MLDPHRTTRLKNKNLQLDNRCNQLLNIQSNLENIYCEPSRENSLNNLSSFKSNNNFNKIVNKIKLIKF